MGKFLAYDIMIIIKWRRPPDKIFSPSGTNGLPYFCNHLFQIIDTDAVLVTVIHYKLNLEHDKLDTEVDDMKWDFENCLEMCTSHAQI